MSAVLFRGVRLGDAAPGTRTDVLFDGASIVRTAPGSGIEAPPDAEIVHGGWLTAPLAEPHVHLDAALLGARRPNRSGTLREGIANWAELRSTLAADDLRARALQTAEMYASYGALRIRTHVDTGSMLAVEVMISLRAEMRERGIELQVVAFPQEGILRGKGRRGDWEAAVAKGVDAVGAIPHFERTAEEGWASVRLAFGLAERHGIKLDFHCDETDDPGSRNLEVVCAETIDRSMAGQVVAGHCTALHGYPNPHAAKVCELVAMSGVQVVCNPLDNVVLQGRYDGYPRRRGLTRVDELLAAGACVGIGHDSVQDPWYRLGTANLLDAAYMLVHVGHLTGEEEMIRVFSMLINDNHRPFGAAPVLREGHRGPMVWWPSADPVDLLRDRPRPTVYGRPMTPSSIAP